MHDFRGCQIFSLFCRLILQTSVRGDILFRIVATRKTRYVSDNKKGLGCGLNKGKMCVSAKYCYVTHELRLHQNDIDARVFLYFSFDSSFSQSRSMGQAVPTAHLTFYRLAAVIRGRKILFVQLLCL